MDLIERIEVVNLQPGDVVFLKCAPDATHEQLDQLQMYLHESLAGRAIPIVLVGEELVEVVRADA